MMFKFQVYKNYVVIRSNRDSRNELNRIEPQKDCPTHGEDIDFGKLSSWHRMVEWVFA